MFDESEGTIWKYVNTVYAQILCTVHSVQCSVYSEYSKTSIVYTQLNDTKLRFLKYKVHKNEEKLS